MIPEKYAKFFQRLNVADHKTLKENKAVLYLKTNYPLYCVTVDKGIIPNIEQGIKKCDFLLWDDSNKAVILIELKGSDIDSAMKQLEMTTKHLEDNKDLSFITGGIKILFACCVSPNAGIPKRGNEHERYLIKSLKKHYKGSYPLKNPGDLLIYIRPVASKQKSVNTNERVINNSSVAPLCIYPDIWKPYIAISQETKYTTFFT